MSTQPKALALADELCRGFEGQAQLDQDAAAELRDKPATSDRVMDYARAYAAQEVAKEREACAAHLFSAGARLLSVKGRTNQIDRHVAEVLQRKAEEIRARSA